MATVTATKTGNWSDPTVWSTGALPQSGDTVRPSTYVVTIDQSVNLGAGILESTTTGYFKVATGGLSITCATVLATYSTVISAEHSSGTLTIHANVTHANTSSDRQCINKTSSGNVIINGAVTGPNGGARNPALRCDNSCGGSVTINGDCLYESVQTYWGAPTHNLIVNGNILPYSTTGVQVPLTATATITGNLTGSNGYSSYAVAVSGVATIIGNLTPPTAANNDNTAVLISAGGRCTITGNVGSLASAVAAGFGVRFNGNSGQATINGNVYGGSSTWYYASGVYCSGGTGLSLTVNGDVYAGTNSYGIVASNMTATINGTVYALDGSTLSGVFANTGSTVHVRKAVGNNYGPGGGSAIGYAILGDRAASLVTVKQVQCGTYGAWPISGFAKLLDDVDLNQVIVPKSTSGTKTLVDVASTGYYPTAANVRSGVSYAAGNLTGTCAVPAAGSVALGVAVDNTTGTAVLTQANVQAVLTGSGPNQVNVTVSSSAGGPVQGAVVRMQATGLGDHTATTNSSGVARFNLPAGTWNLTAALNGFRYDGSTQVVSTNPQAIAITMTATSVSVPSSPNKSVGALLCLDSLGDPESGVTVSFQMVAGPGNDGYSLDAEIVEEECDSEGILEREFLRGATYDAWRGVRGARVRFVVPDAASFDLPEHLGVD